MHSTKQLYEKEYRKKNHDRIYQRNKKWREEHLEQARASNRKYFWKNRDKIRKRTIPYGRKRYQNNREKLLQVSNKWREDHPEKFLEYQIKYLSRFANALEMKYFEYKSALMFWSKTIRKNSDNLCFCGEKATQSHHIIHKSTYPELSLNLNNGIALCLQHHYEAHGKRR